jgi:DNA polymerase, archaea type
MNNKLIFGKNDKTNIVGCEVVDSNIELFIEDETGVRSEFIPNEYWILCNKWPDKTWKPLQGSLFYKYIKKYETRQEYYGAKKRLKSYETFSVGDEKEAAMLLQGFTYFKGMKVNDVSILSFDIETTGLNHRDDSHILLISNTYRKNGEVLRVLFSIDEYESEADMIDDWCRFVRELNPSIMTGHNIYCYDLPYMTFCAEKCGTSLAIGRDGSDIRFNSYDSDFRVDGSKDLSYKKAFVYGRELADTMFIAYKYDFARKYESYRLKQIILQEGLEVKDRQHYDAATIKDNWHNLEEREKIKKYAMHDADDALALYDLMVPAYFYLNQSVPKSFQSMITSASGSQINSLLVRSYLQEGQTLPKTSEANKFEGAISFGNPGVYSNVFKVDVASLYPSIMLEHQIYDKFKDPSKNFLKMVNYFTEERLNNKKLAKEKNDRYYKDLSEAQKIVINSAYGMMGASGLLFNSPSNASFVTRKGREILQTAIDWAKAEGFTIVNADTDSISISFNGEDLSLEDRSNILNLINSLYPDRIRFEDDGYYANILVVKAKNYVLDDGKKLKIKGSALKAPMKEKALQELIRTSIDYLLKRDPDRILALYKTYVAEIYNISDISRWVTKKTITDKVLNNTRTNEAKIRDAIADSDYKEGDRAFFYFDMEGNQKLQENWKADHDPSKLLGKLYKTVSVFETVLNIDDFLNYSLKKNENLARELAGLPPLVKEKKSRKKKCDSAA